MEATITSKQHILNSHFPVPYGGPPICLHDWRILSGQVLGDENAFQNPIIQTKENGLSVNRGRTVLEIVESFDPVATSQSE
jgi:hypothetical protein